MILSEPERHLLPPAPGGAGGRQAAACILASIGSLVISEVSHWWLVQAVVRLGAMGSVVRVAHWLELHMELVVRCRPAVFTALAVEDRLAAGRAADWGLVLDRLAVVPKW